MTMTTARRSLLAAVALSAWWSCAGVVPVYISFGQSNELGNNKTSLRDPMWISYTGRMTTVIYTLSEDYYGKLNITNGALRIPMRSGVLATNRFGAEMVFCHVTQPRYGSSIAYVKHTKDGASITNWEGNGQGWINLCKAVTQTTNHIVKTLHQTPDIRWVSMMQGEADAIRADTGPEYYQHLTNVILRVRKRFGPVHFAVCRLSHGTGITWRQWHEDVRKAQTYAAMYLPDVTVLNTDGWPTHDGTHFSGQGLINLGLARAADAEQAEFTMPNNAGMLVIR
jgi:hypothetical protein